ncbi:MAG TPA: glucose-1-phosphate adenylyltransferase [Candidatus Omnitrophota bacterium]|nr:glucose-1-phosphate adenylyltransferase [Candidatus Omnitrophota bacterium]
MNPTSQNVLTFIMAGGKGERLWPLTKDRTKPAVPFGGIYRIVDFSLSNCINSGLRRVYVLTQYKSASLQRHIRLGWNILSSELNEFIEPLPAQQRIGETWYLGTADAIYQNLNTLEMDPPEDVLILAGDHVYKMNYSYLIEGHRNSGADVTLGVVEVDKSLSAQFGVAEIEEDGTVKDFKEKPQHPKTIPGKPDKILASMGIYVFKMDKLIEKLVEDAHDETSAHDFGKNIIPRMVKEGYSVQSYNFIDENKKSAQYWRDIGTIDAYYEANMDLVQVEPVFNLYDRDWPVRTYQEQFPPAKTVFAGEEITGRVGLAVDSMVCGGCIISGGQVKRSILAPNVRVNSFSQVTDSILMEGVDIGRHAKIRRTIIDKGVNIPAGMVIGYDANEDKKRFYVSESGLVVVAKHTEIT